MRVTVKCTCGCGHEFEVDVPRPTRNITDEDRQRRSELMKEVRKMSTSRGKTFGAKDIRVRKIRSDKGVSRATKRFMADFDDVSHFPKQEEESRVKELTRKFIEAVRGGENDTESCPMSQANGGPCDGIHIDADGNMSRCGSMQDCYFMTLKYLHPLKREANRETEDETEGDA